MVSFILSRNLMLAEQKPYMTKRYKRIEIKLIHTGESEPRMDGAVVLPIFQTATYEYYRDEGI